MPGSASMRFASARAMASTTSFSACRLPDGARILAAMAGIDGDDHVAPGIRRRMRGAHRRRRGWRGGGIGGAALPQLDR